MKSTVWAPRSQRDDTWELGQHIVPAAQDLSGTATGARTTRKPAPGAGAQSPCVPQKQQGRLGQACLPKPKHKAVQPELEGVPNRCHLQSVAANGTAPWHDPQPRKGCAPSCLELHLRSPHGSLCHLHCICAQHQAVSSTDVPPSHGDPSTPFSTVLTVAKHIT